MPDTQVVKVKTYVELLPNEEMIWIGKPYFGENLTVKYSLILGVNLIYILFITYQIIWKGFLKFDFKNLDFYAIQVIALTAFVVAFLALFKAVAFLLNQNSMTYGFSNLRVFWARKDFKVIINELAFSKIAQINLVGTNLNDKLFSIYFSPTETLDFEGYNYDDDESRPFPSFEKVIDGDVVYLELMKRWKELRSEN